MKINKLVVVGVLVLGIGVGALTLGSSDTEKKEVLSSTTTTNSRLTEIQKNISQGALLVDVRTPEEYKASHAEGAQNLPLDKIVTGTYPTKDKSTQIYLYCRSGKRAGQAKDVLVKAGYTKVESLGGLSGWQALGGNTE